MSHFSILSELSFLPLYIWQRYDHIYPNFHRHTHTHIYIYIDRERIRERERCIGMCNFKHVLFPMCIDGRLHGNICM